MDMEILVIDDDDSLLFIFKKLLSKNGVKVVVVNSFNKAIENLYMRKFDLIFSDINLPDNTGINILEESKKTNQNCPIIIITGSPEIKTVSEAVRQGAFDYLVKPLDFSKLIYYTENLLKKRKSIKEQEIRFANIDAVFKNINVGIISVNTNLEIIEINNTAEKMFKIKNTQVKGKPFNSLLIRCECGIKALEAINETLSSKQRVEIEVIECTHNNQSSKLSYISTFPLIDYSNIFYGCGLIIGDKAGQYYYEMNLKKREQYYNMIDNSSSFLNDILPYK